MAAGRIARAATVSGQVTDDGNAIPDAYVVINLGGGNMIIDAKNTDRTGNYQFTVSPGVYNICVSVDDCEYGCVKDIKLQGKDINVDVKMKPSAFVDKKKDAALADCD